MTTTTATATITGLTTEQAAFAIQQGADYMAKVKKLATVKRAPKVQADMDAHAVPVADMDEDEALASANQGAIDELTGFEPVIEVTIDLPESPESYLARLMGEGDAAPTSLEPVVARLRSGVAALQGTAKGAPGVNDHAMVRPAMKAAGSFAHAVFAGGWAPGEAIVAHMSSGHQSRLYQASPVVGGRHVIADPEAQGPSKSVACAWLSPAGQAGLLINVGRGVWCVQPELFDVLSSGVRAALADERAANRAAYGMGPDPLLEDEA